MSELFTIVFQSVSGFALLRICVDLGKVLKTIEGHDRRIEKLEDKF